MDDWNKAELARVRVERRRLLLIRLMQERSRELGRPPTARDFAGVRGTHYPSYLTFIRAFGSFNAAKTAAGFEPNSWKVR